MVREAQNKHRESSAVGRISGVKPYALIVCLFVAGCGTMVGNPKQPDGSDGGDQPKAVIIPIIDFELPDEIINEEESATLNLTTTIGNYTVLHGAVQGTHQVLRDINRTLRLLNNEQVQETGTFSNKTCYTNSRFVIFIIQSDSEISFTVALADVWTIPS